MTIERENLLKSILESLGRIEHIRLEDIPNIDLYMDQVTTFMDKQLKNTTRNPEGDKILTKTMINSWPCHSPVLRHIKFSQPMGLSFH